MSKRVLITGGAHRLGAELVRLFAQAGWTVWCHYQHSALAAQSLQAELRGAGSDVQVIQADLAEPSGIHAMMSFIEGHGGALQTVINNASLFEPDLGTDMALKDAKRQIDVNLIAPMYLGQLLAHQQIGKGATEACLIHILDQKVFNLNPDYFSYTVSKLALERSVALQAQALAPAVRVCGVAPGLMYLSGPQTRDNFERAASANLLRRPTDPLDVARTCLFLASTASITGTVVSVDNGQHLVPLPRDIMFVVDDLLKGITP